MRKLLKTVDTLLIPELSWVETSIVKLDFKLILFER